MLTAASRTRQATDGVLVRASVSVLSLSTTGAIGDRYLAPATSRPSTSAARSVSLAGSDPTTAAVAAEPAIGDAAGGTDALLGGSGQSAAKRPLSFERDRA